MPRLTKSSFRARNRHRGRIGFAHANDPLGALWTGLRAALAVFLVSSFWILTNWAHGSTAVVLAAVATARLATMAPAVPIAVAGTLIFALATIPAFIIVEVLLPLGDGFGMFALAVAPMLFFCALLMAHKKTMLIGYLSALLFASAGQFLNRMNYDPVGMLNTCIAAVVAAATSHGAVRRPGTGDAGSRAPPFCPHRSQGGGEDRGPAPARRAHRIRDRDDRGSWSAAKPTPLG